MAEQMSGLIEALTLIHNDMPQFGWRENRPEHYLSDVKHVYGRHGDLKPENILFFQNPGGKSDLVLADFGLGKLHSKISQRGEDPRTLGRTETYRAPEFDLPGGLITPAADIWSLGCVFLEYVSWYLREANVIEDEFSQARLANDSNTMSTESFFSIEKGKNERERAVLKPTVRLWIRRLKENDNTTAYLKQILDIIEHEMLDLDATSRIKATALREKFKYLFYILITRRMNNKMREERDRVENRNEQLLKMLSAANSTIVNQKIELVEAKEEIDCQKEDTLLIKEDCSHLLAVNESWVEKITDLQDKYDGLVSTFAMLPTSTDKTELSTPRRRGASGANIKKKSRRHDALPLPGDGDHQNQYDGLVARYKTSLPTPPHSEASSTSRQSRVSSFSTSRDHWEDRERFRQEHRRERRSHSQEKERLARRFEKYTEIKRSHASARRNSVVGSKSSSHILSTPQTFDMPLATTRHTHEQRPVTDQVKSDSPQNDSSRKILFVLSLLYIHIHAFTQ
jgi:serine/threonine protein kinase